MRSLKSDSHAVNPFSNLQPVNLTAAEWGAMPKYTPDYSAPAKDLAHFAHRFNFSVKMILMARSARLLGIRVRIAMGRFRISCRLSARQGTIWAHPGVRYLVTYSAA